jgi:hypothetical protein
MKSAKLIPHRLDCRRFLPPAPTLPPGRILFQRRQPAQQPERLSGKRRMSISSLTSLLNGGSQSLTASSMNNAAGIMSYCAKQKLASVTNTENVKNQVLDKLGLSTPEKQKEDTSYLEGLQGF